MKRIVLSLLLCTGAFAQIGVVRKGELVTAGTAGVTANLAAKSDGSNPSKYVIVATGECGEGIAASTAASTATFYLQNKPGIDVTVVAEGTVTVDHYLTAAVSTAGRVLDTGFTDIADVPNTTCIIGRAKASATAGNTFNASYLGPRKYGNKVVHVIGATFDGAGTALTGGASVVSETVTVPFACTIKSWFISVDTGTATFAVWKKATGTSIPTSADSISTSGIAISSNTAIDSTTLSDFTTTSIAANDQIIFNLNAVSSATKAHVELRCY